MDLKLKISPKIAYYVSSIITFIIFSYFAYKAVVAYLIYKELYGDGIDILVTLRASLAGIMLFLIILFIQFTKIKDLNSQRTILKGIFIGWSAVFIVLIIVNIKLIPFLVLTGFGSLFTLVTVFSLIDQIKEDRNTLTDKEIYLLQQLANKK